jgi:hypothetical protein
MSESTDRGVLLVAGSAACLLADLEAAEALFPLATILTVNGAAAVVEAAEHCLAGHTEKAEEFAAARRAAFPNARPVRWHANWGNPRRPAPKVNYPSVTDWWGPEMSSGATSAGKAALIGIAMNFSKIVLCGCPMDGSGYVAGETKGISQSAACARIGDPKAQSKKIIMRYRARMAELAQTTFKGRVFSMSGFTAEVLGRP